MKIVDTRVRLLTEVINNIRAVKLYAYEVFFGEKVSALRRGELAKIRRNGLNRATMNSSMTFVPILAAVLTFITYSLSGHDLNPAIIFSGLQYFNILKQPLTMLPMVFTACSDAAVAITRIGHALRAEELVSDLKIDKNQKMAIKMEGDFEFDSVNPPDTAGGAKLGMRDRAGKREKKKQAEKDKKEAKERKKQGLSVIETKKVEKKDEEEGVPFSLRDIALHVPRGTWTAHVSADDRLPGLYSRKSRDGQDDIALCNDQRGSPSERRSRLWWKGLICPPTRLGTRRDNQG